ncbi:MAG: hypothetical protein WBP10_00190 [Thermoanaerobaculia bacterium]
MRSRMTLAALVLLLLAASGPAAADDLSEATALLCSSSWAMVCTSVEDCESGPPWEWNIPQFVEVDLESKMLSTTEASGEDRTTPAEVLRREDGLIFIQGMEFGRAFSIVVAEDIGSMSAAIAGEDFTVSVFGACTPLPAGR